MLGSLSIFSTTRRIRSLCCSTVALESGVVSPDPRQTTSLLSGSITSMMIVFAVYSTLAVERAPRSAWL
jgi:hypothetical protein